MRLTIVSGRSGSGKTVALNSLEDLGFYCVDNLPVDMLLSLRDKLHTTHPKLAVSIDARNLPTNLSELKNIITELKRSKLDECKILYFDADDKILLKRFSETRRKHPLTNVNTTLQEAIQQERRLLNPLASIADISVDTSYLSKHQLNSLMRDKVAQEAHAVLQLLLLSFGFKHGMPPEADFVFDVRCLPNPYWYAELRNLTGLDKEIISFLGKEEDVKKMIDDIIFFLKNWVPKFEQDNRSYLTIAVGCTGGQHRSVYIIEEIEKQAKNHFTVQTRHRDLYHKGAKL